MNPVDALGMAKAKLADFEESLGLAALREAVLALGEGQHDGDLFRATVKLNVKSTRIDPKAAREILPPGVITALSKDSFADTVTVRARSGALAAAA